MRKYLILNVGICKTRTRQDLSAMGGGLKDFAKGGMGVDYCLELGQSGLAVHKGGNFLHDIRAVGTKEVAAQNLAGSVTVGTLPCYDQLHKALRLIHGKSLTVGT